MAVGLDSASAADRLAPGGPGTGFKFTADATAGAAQQFRPASDAKNACYWAIKVTMASGAGGVHLVFGSATVGAPTVADTPFEAADGWQDVLILPDVTHVRAIGDLTFAGSVYLWKSGR